MSSLPIDYAKLEALVDASLARHVPESFEVRKLAHERRWELKKRRPKPSEWHWQEYDLRITSDMQWIIATYGNHDIGCGLRPQWSLVLPVSYVDHGALDPLRELIERLFTQKPNEWGYT